MADAPVPVSADAATRPATTWDSLTEAEQREALAMLDAVERHRKRVAESANDPGHYRVLYGGRAVYVPSRYDEDLPDFLRRCANEIERLLTTDCSDKEDVSHMTVDWEMDEGWSACLVIE